MPTPGTEIYADQLSLRTGGGAAITACNFASLGHPTELCANLPAPPFFTVVREELDTHLNLQYCSSEHDCDPQITVALTGSMDRSFVTRRSGPALPVNYRDSIQHCTSSKSVGHLHIGELATLLEYPDLIALARAAQWTISLDCAWDIDAMGAAEALPLIKSVDVFLPNEMEFKQLANIGVTETTAPLTVIKKGEEGSQAFGENGLTSVPAVTCNCVDATGAGDAFNAGFIHSWLQNQSIEDCLQSGNHRGAIAVQHVGGIG